MKVGSPAPLLFASFASGVAALAYEMLWTRIATYLIGSDAYALGAVLGLFSVSLAAGAVASARFLRTTRPLRAYAAIESTTAAVGATQAATWLFCREPVARAFSSLWTTSPVAAVLACGLTLVVFPGVLMGMTLPLLVAAIPGPLGVRNAYASNVLGAFVGALLVGGLVLAWLSISAGFGVAIASGLAAAASATLSGPGETAVRGERVPLGALLRPSLPSVSAFLAGVASFALEVLLFRVVRTRLGSASSDWTIAVLVGLFLAGLSLGGLLFTPAGDPRLSRLSWLLAAPGLVITLMLGFFASVAPEILGAVHAGFKPVQLVLLSVLVTSIAAPFGYLFPYLVDREVELAHWEPRTATARILVSNSLGNLCGSVAAGFVVVPSLGSGRGLALPLLILAIVGRVLPAPGWLRGRRAALVASLAAAALVLVAPARLLFPMVQRASLVEAREDAFGNYLLLRTRTPGFRLFRYGQPVSATLGDQLDNTRLALDLIELMGKARSRIVAAGLGGACHLREAAVRSERGPDLYRDLKVIEISPAVLRLARAHYGLPESALSHVERGDFRRHLREASADVYYVDLLSPAIEGSGFSFTREFHEEVRRSLSPGGMLVQWFGRFGAVDFLAEITRTLDSVYRGGYVLRTAAGHYLYVATKEPEGEGVLGDRLAALRTHHAATGGPGFEYWPTKVVLERLGVSSPSLITEDRIPFGRLLLGTDRAPALAREARLRGEP